MRERSAHNKLAIILVAIGAVILAAIIGAAIYTGINASNGDPMPSYIKKDTSQALGTSTNPYTILEIVPDVESATVGYLINGDEPNNLLAIGATNKNDPESAAGLYASAFASASSKESEIGEYTDAYIFDNDKGSIGTVPQSGFIEKKDEYQSEVAPGSDMAYSEYGYYTKVTSGTGNYRYNNGCFEPYYGGDYTWTKLGEFKYVGFGQGQCSRLIGRTYSYNNSTKTGAVGDKAYAYTYSPVGDFTFTPSNKYNNENYYAENASASDIEAATLGTNLYMTRTENVYYQYESSQIIVYDKLLEELVGQGTTGNNYSTQVVTVTPRQLNVKDSIDGVQAKDIIDTADMIIVHNSATGYKIARALQDETADEIPQFSSNGTSGDFNPETVKYIVDRGASANPAAIVFDEEAIQIASEGNCDGLESLYDVYNNLGAKLTYNWKMSEDNYANKVKEASNLPNYRYFSFDEQDALGKSHYVYNYTGEDDSWLTIGFANDNMIAKSNLNEPAFYNVSAGDTMSVAKMLSAINKESNGYNQPKNIRILELQPNEQYYYDANDRDSWVWRYVNLFPWFVGTDSDITKDVTITAMPTYEFVGRNEDPNEHYDLILIGNKMQDETNGANGYNDPMLQLPIPVEAGGDGTTPSPVSYTAVGDLITTYGYTSYPVNQEYEASIEDYDNPSNRRWTAYRWNTDKVNPEPDSSSSNYSYKWKYGLFKNNRWYNTRNASPLMGESYNIGFARNFVVDVVGSGQEVLWSFFNEWTWVYQKTKNFVYGTKHGSDANMIGLRYSGNDITKKKYEQLLDFSTQAPLVVADDLYWAEINPGWSQYANAYKIDQSSFVYKIANMNNKDDSTVHKFSNCVDADMDANKVKKEMVSDNLSATFTDTLNHAPGLPTEYDANAAINYNQQTDGAGNNVLQYHFTLNGNESSTYGISLYTDSNGNGIFEGCINQENERVSNGGEKGDDEKSSNLIIFDETPYFKNYVTNGVLYSGHTYLVTRILPPSEVGLVPWKLELYKQGNDSVRFSQEGYTRIRPADSSQKTVINVLQMNPNPNMSGNGYDSVTVCFANHYRYKLDTNWYGQKIPNATAVNSQEMSNLFNVEDFKIQVDFMDNDYWLNVYGSDRDKWVSALMEYDMLIIGFKDMAQLTNNENYLYAFEEFRKKGKSIILTHDLCEDATMGIMENTDNYNTDKIIQSDVRYYLRDISGQLRKYYNAEADEAHKNDYSYLNYRSRGQDLTFEPSNYFNIYTFIRELKMPGFGDYNIDYLMQNEEDKARTPIYNKYTYTYGVFAYDDKDDNWKYTYDPNQKIWLTSPISVIREYYDKKDGSLDGKWTNKPAGIIQDNSTRSMLYYSTINYDNDSGKFLDNLDRAVNLARTDLVWQTKTFETNKVQAVNEGQITKYPYAIPDTLNVGQTHTQNYQLDLEYDDEGDVLIWYNLTGGGIYKGRNQDCRNDYYIYTKGNITYTGVGHNGDLKEDEKKLFVNTMIAAYRSGASDPYIIVTNQDAVNNGNNTMLYVEDRQSDGSADPITYRIADDTTNSKIDRGYQIFVYKFDGYDSNGNMINPEVLVSNMKGDLTSEYTIPVSYSEVYTKGEVKYKILLNSSYTDNQGVEHLTTVQRDVTVTLLPMFNMR